MLNTHNKGSCEVFSGFLYKLHPWHDHISWLIYIEPETMILNKVKYRFKNFITMALIYD